MQIKPHLVLLIMLNVMVVPFESVDEILVTLKLLSLCCTLTGVLTFELKDLIPKCDHSKEKKFAHHFSCVGSYYAEHKAVLHVPCNFKSVDKLLQCDHLNEKIIAQYNSLMLS